MLTKLTRNEGRKSKNSIMKVKQELLTWICEKHATNSPLSRELLREKALQLKKQFSANGNLRHNISHFYHFHFVTF